ncbi:hypothetical protein CH063_14662, partial [Colletotrichum higginsianum]
MRVGVAGTPGCQVGLECDDGQGGDHGDQAGHLGVASVEDGGETWISERGEGRRKKMDEGRREKDAGAEVLAVEEDDALGSALGSPSREQGDAASCWMF